MEIKDGNILIHVHFKYHISDIALTTVLKLGDLIMSKWYWIAPLTNWRAYIWDLSWWSYPLHLVSFQMQYYCNINALWAPKCNFQWNDFDDKVPLNSKWKSRKLISMIKCPALAAVDFNAGIIWGLLQQNTTRTPTTSLQLGLGLGHQFPPTRRTLWQVLTLVHSFLELLRFCECVKSGCNSHTAESKAVSGYPQKKRWVTDDIQKLETQNNAKIYTKCGWQIKHSRETLL